MTIYTLTTDGQTVTTTATLPPTGARRLDTGAWVTPPADGWTADLAAACGWLPVVETPRPADTDTHTHEATYTVTGSTVTQAWTARAWTAGELAARAEADARLDNIEARLERIEAHLWPPVDPNAEVPATVPTMADYGGIWPAGQLLSDGGKVWRNATTVPLTTAPSDFPGAPSQWTRLFVEHGGTEPEPSEWPAWKPWDNQPTSLYAQDAKVSHNGRRWIADVGNNHWEPGVYGWTDAGPA